MKVVHRYRISAAWLVVAPVAFAVAIKVLG